MENNKLFSEFPPVSTEKWEEIINKDLKGADYEKKLVWKTIEGFSVKPYYRAEDLEDLAYLNTNPNEMPFVRSTQVQSNVWDIRQDIWVKNPEEANKIAVDAINRGVTSLGLCVREVTTCEQMEILLKNIDLTKIKINFICSQSYLPTLKLLVEVAKKYCFDTKEIAGSINFDIFNYALTHGEFYNNEEANYEEAKEILHYIDSELPKFKGLTVNGSLFHNAGSSIVQELGCTLAGATELIAKLTEKGCRPESVASNMQFSFAIGSNYFMEMAKIRAARMLWTKIVEQYHPKCMCAYDLHIHATSSLWNKSIFDAYVNMLRTTTETMSAAIAGVNSISVAPFDVTYKNADDFSYRVSRNQQILLKEESYLDKIVDPAAGSYYIENITDAIAQHAWKMFLDIEALGGFGKAIHEGFIQNEIEKTALQRNQDIATRKTIILGTNQYPNLSESMSEKIQKATNCEKKSPSGNIKILHEYRGAEAFETLRIATEKSTQKPKVFLLTYGNLAMRKARSGFATNFFGVAGYEIIDNTGFLNAEEGANAALEANADIVVMCSSDDEYAEIVPNVCKLLKGKVKSIVIAGYPKEQIETYKAIGVNDFIHMKTNVLESLTHFQQLMGLVK